MPPVDHTIKHLIKDLQSGKEGIIIETIRKLYVNGSVEVLPYLFRLYFVSKSQSIQHEILGLLNNLKDNQACPYFIEAFEKYKGQESFNLIVSSCWQNGLDFSNELKIFIDLVIEEDFFTAVEAFSVVEGNIAGLSPAERETQAIYVRSKLNFVDDERKKLINELLHVVENISGPFTINLN